MSEEASLGKGRRVFFYVQHLLGIGHLARASHICQALLAQGYGVTMVTGGKPVSGFPGPGIDHVELPAILSADGGFSGLVDEHGQPVDAAFEDKRKALLLKAFADAKPDIVIIEAFPFGRRQVRFELLPLLDAIANCEKRPLLLSSVRDILQENRKPGRDEETLALIHGAFDGVLVHGDPHFVALEESFPKAASIADKIFYTGLVAKALPPTQPAQTFDIIVSAGGGAVGQGVMQAALAASRFLPLDLTWCMITGPNLAEADYQAMLAARPQNMQIFRFRADFPVLLQGARLSISQSGYNTVCDLMMARLPSLLIPFAAGGETEQTVRAEKLRELGLALVLPEAGLEAKALAEAVLAGLQLRFPETLPFSMDGAAETGRILNRLLSRR